jgi:hypothetical protein
MSCSHVGTDLANGRESLADAIRQSEEGGSDGAPPFGWDFAVHVGDHSGAQRSPTDEEGTEIVRQFGASKSHAREDFYCVAGNHDAPMEVDAPLHWWFRRWIDPMGENTEYSGVRRSELPYPIEGTWERYSFAAGNLFFLMMSDRNDFPPPIGRAGASSGGYPAGAVTGETFEWWKHRVEAGHDKIVVSAHHHMLKETTVASGPWEGMARDEDGEWRSSYHGYRSDGAPEGASYLYFVDGRPDAQAFEGYLAANPAAVDIWLGGHTHSNPDDRKGGRSHVERKWGCNFINVSALSKYHGLTNVPMSRLLTFTDGSVDVRVQCYLHTSDYAPQGWYARAERTLRLSRPAEL